MSNVIFLILWSSFCTGLATAPGLRWIDRAALFATYLSLGYALLHVDDIVALVMK